MTANATAAPPRTMVDSTPLLGDAAALRRRLDADSHLLFRGLLPRDDVLAVRGAIAGVLERTGWIAPGTDPMEARPGPSACREGEEGFFPMYAAAQGCEAFHRFAHHPQLRSLAESVLGGELIVYPLKILRAALPQDPDFITPAHQDYPLIQGSVDVLTMWIPLGDVPLRMGGLRVLTRSHRHGFRRVRRRHGTGGVGVDVRDDDARWVHSDYAAGDVLLFHSLSVHGSRPNTTDRLRLSVDFRYQRADEPIAAFCLKPHWFPHMPPVEELTRGWETARWFDAPEGVHSVEHFDILAERRTPPSRLLTVGGRR